MAMIASLLIIFLSVPHNNAQSNETEMVKCSLYTTNYEGIFGCKESSYDPVKINCMNKKTGEKGCLEVTDALYYCNIDSPKWKIHHRVSVFS